MEVLKVATNTNVNKLAGAIAKIMERQETVELRMVGAGTVNIAMKSIAVARGFTAAAGKELVCAPGFLTYEDEGLPRTMLRIIVMDKNR